MNNDLMLKYETLVEDYPNLCFKVYDEKEDAYNLCIATNDGIIYYEVEEYLYSRFDIYNMESYKKDCLLFGDFILGDDNSLDNLDLEDAEAFFVIFESYNGKCLIDYFGNKEEVILPDRITHLAEEVFCGMDHIKSIKGKNVSWARSLGFCNMENLEKVEFDKLKYSNTDEIFYDLKGLPNLKEIKLYDGSILIDDDKIVIKTLKNTSQYVYDKDLDKKLSEHFCVVTDENDKDDFVSAILINGQDKRFHCREDEFNDFLYRMYYFEVEYANKYSALKDILDDNNYSYVIGNLGLRDPLGNLVGGFFLEDQRFIGIENKCFNQYEFAGNFMHEVGHAVYSMIDDANKMDFELIYEKEKDKFVNGRCCMYEGPVVKEHLRSNSHEYFAQTFAMSTATVYTTNDKEILKEECPNTFIFVNNAVESLKRENKKEKVKIIIK